MLEVRLRRIDGSPAQQSAAAWALLRETLVGLGYGDLPEIVRNRWGKPCFAGNPVYFNLSHTQGAAAVAVCDREVGIDIQTVCRISPRVAERWLHTDETDPAVLTRMWAEYESYGKFLGCGIPITLPDRPHAVQTFDLGGILLAVCTPDGSACQPRWVD